MLRVGFLFGFLSSLRVNSLRLNSIGLTTAQRLSSSKTRKRLGLVYSALIGTAILASSPATEAQVDPALIQALQQETHDSSTNTTDLESLAWLSAMSAKLEKRIPNAFYRIRLLSAVYREAVSEGLDPQLVLALIDIESNFDRNALSHAGAQGLMQVMPFWKKEIGEPSDDLFNPITSLRYGCKILRHYLDSFPNAVEALAAYNGSRGRTVYPDKVLGRLKSRWQYQSDSYAKSSSNRALKVAASDAESASGKLVLN